MWVVKKDESGRSIKVCGWSKGMKVDGPKKKKLDCSKMRGRSRRDESGRSTKVWVIKRDESGRSTKNEIGLSENARAVKKG